MQAGTKQALRYERILLHEPLRLMLGIGTKDHDGRADAVRASTGEDDPSFDGRCPQPLMVGRADPLVGFGPCRRVGGEFRPISRQQLI